MPGMWRWERCRVSLAAVVFLHGELGGIFWSCLGGLQVTVGVLLVRFLFPTESTCAEQGLCTLVPPELRSEPCSPSPAAALRPPGISRLRLAFLGFVPRFSRVTLSCDDAFRVQGDFGSASSAAGD